jgi:hypothetical protein
MQEATQKSWLGRNWKWLVPVGCLGVVGLSVAFCGGILAIIFTSMRSSWAFTEGLELARRNPAVVAELGEPIEAGWLVTGSINVSGPSGNAELAIPISGPKGAGTRYVVARKKAGDWTFEQAQVVIESTGERIDLLKPRPRQGNRLVASNSNLR